MRRVFWQILALVVCVLTMLGFSARAQKEILGGFTPNASVTIAFPKSEYPRGGTAPAEISIAGSPDGKYTVSVKDDKDSEVGSIELEIGGAPGSNTGTLNIGLPADAESVTYTATVTIGDATPQDSATLTLKAVREWEATPAIVVGELFARDTNVRPGQAVTISIEASDEDTWTDFDGKTGTDPDTALRYTWDPGTGTIREGEGTASIVWVAPKDVAASSPPTQVSCTVDDSLSAGETGVSKPATGTRNDDPSEIKSVSIQVSPKPCGEWVHDHWDEASAVNWTEIGGNPVPSVPPAKEHIKWEDDCSNTTKNPKSEVRLYLQVAQSTVREADGSTYLEVEYQAFSGHGGPDTALLKGRHLISKNWTVGDALSGGGAMIAPSAGEQVKAGESVTVVMNPASDSDTWTRGSYRQDVGDSVKYSWTASVGSFSETPTGSVATWNAPSLADVPAGAEGLTVTITCSADDSWGEGQTGVSAPDTGTRNDTKGVSASVSFQVLREPCGRWLHKAWGESAALNWKTDGNGDPEPIDPDSISETLRWEDTCAATTKADKTSDVSYQKIKDEAVEDEGVWYREVEYQAFSAAASGEAAPKLSGRRALPRHWTTPGELDGGDLKVTVTGAPDQGEIAPTKAGQAVVATISAGAGAGASFAITGARDTDTYSYWNVPEKGADDGLRYKWTLNGGPEDGTPIDEVDLGSGSSAALPSQPVLLAGSYTVKCEVDDSSSDGESGVAAPDLGDRNDGPATHTVVIQVVATDWEAGQGIGSHPKTDEDGKQIEPVEWVEDGQLKAPAPGSETKAVPGEAVELEVNPASDWDAWTRDGIGSGIGADGPLTYKWTATGGKFRVKDGQGNPSEVTEVDGLKATWIAPAPDPNANNGEGEDYTVTCTIDDGTLPRTTPPNESGSHDDEALKREVSIEVVPSYWAPEDKAIGFHPTLDETTQQPIKPYQWNEDGRITAPIDQRLEGAPEEKVVLPGQSVTATIEPAQDWDTLTTLEGKSIAKDEALTYTWSSGELGHFLIPGENGGEPTQAAMATGLSVTWVAPDDITEDTDVELKCTVDDGDIDVAPIGGSRDDEKLERIVAVKVVLSKVEFEGQARSCAGGVAVDGVHDFTITGTAKLPDGAVPPMGTEFKLVDLLPKELSF